MKGILESGSLRPSLKAVNPKDARFGDGQYLTDIVPGSRSPASIARELIGRPNKYKFTNYVEIDTMDLPVVVPPNRAGVYIIRNDGDLDIINRIIGSGKG